jgi:Do/DeqQ family serine protease
MSKKQMYVNMVLSAATGALVAALILFYFLPQPGRQNTNTIQREDQVALTGYLDTASMSGDRLNFIHAANKVTPGVVHIRTLYSSGRYSVNPLENMFRAPARSSGSGVVISPTGYIVTNNHVIEDARQVEVVLSDNRQYVAEIIGTDPTTDLALLKIEANNLVYVPYGNSDYVYPGEWVLAIGNPFDLNSTVTAGIVSAKARNIGILRDRNNLQIESFIQTDAAVNPGNSGGALVNLRGELVGINTAIATPNGSYAGYSFAVPVALVKKVMDDLLEFGEVKRGLLGIGIGDVNAQVAEDQNLNVMSGVFVSYVNENSAAEDAGIVAGDVIVGINKLPVTNVSELQELVARNRPGDKIEVDYIRNGLEKNTTAILRDFEGNISIQPTEILETFEGATFEPVGTPLRESFGIEGGLRVKELQDGPWKEAGIRKGFIITRIDKVLVTDLEKFNQVLRVKNGSFLVEGVYENGEEGIYGINW